MENSRTALSKITMSKSIFSKTTMSKSALSKIALSKSAISFTRFDLRESDEISATDIIQSRQSEIGSRLRFSVGTDSLDADDVELKWRNIPRSASDFYQEIPKTYTCSDADYEAWLENYYQELYLEQTKKECLEKETQTEEETGETESCELLTSFFQPVEKDAWSYNTKYWGPKGMRRHWPLRLGRNEYLFMPSAHPDLNLRSRYGRFYSLLHSAAALPEVDSHKLVNRVFRKNLFGLQFLNPQLLKIMICELLCNFKSFDFMSKEEIVRSLCKLLRNQSHLEKVYFENMGLERKDGIILLCALSRKGGDVIKELHIWKMFGYGECPVLLGDLTRKGEILPSSETIKFLTQIHYLQVLNKFSSLTHLSINYAYLANRRGNVLLHLKCIVLGRLQHLRLYCSMDERPLLTNPGYGAGGWRIPDGVWRRVAELCPELRVSFVFLNMPQYENVILFLSKYAPVSYVYLSSGMDFRFDVPWDIDSTLLELRNWYAPTLETLCLHLWQHRDLLDFVIKDKILEEFPNLINFEFIGVLERVETLEQFCCELSKGTYKMKSLLFWVEEQHTNQTKLTLTRKKIPPFVYYIIKDDAVVLQGSLGQLWNILEERLGFTSEYMIESYGAGVLNFINKRRDVLLRPSVISSEDVDQFDFTYHIGSTWYEVYLKDSDEINSSNSYVRNWSMGIWIFTGIMIFLFTFLLYFMLHISDKFLLRDIYIVPAFERSFSIIQNLSFVDNKFNLPRNWRKMKAEYQNLKTKNDKSLGNCFIAAISVFCSQGVYLPTNAISVRLAMLSFLIFGMIMYNSYSALLVSQLTLGERFLPFDTLEEIPVKGKDYSLCVRTESYPYLYFTVNKSGSSLQKKWENIINRKPCPNDGIFDLEEMCEPYVAFLEAPAVMKELSLGYNNCKMMNLKGRYFNINFGLMILKGFEENAKKEINKEILRYREVGILSYLENKWIEQNNVILESENQKLQVTFEHIKGILFVYICCLAFCSSLFFLETLLYIRRRQHKLFP